MYGAWLFVVALSILAKSTDRGFWVGIPVIFLGECVRIWSHGYIQKTLQLATEGPYAYVRNPLYVGNFLIGSGFCLIIWHPMVAVIFVMGFYLVYWVTIKGEEQRLADKFQGAYQDYLKRVPRFIPRLTSYERYGKGVFVLSRAWRHGEHITILAIASFLILIYLRQELFQERQLFSEIALSPIFSFVILVTLLLLSMRLRYFGKRVAKA